MPNKEFNPRLSHMIVHSSNQNATEFLKNVAELSSMFGDGPQTEITLRSKDCFTKIKREKKITIKLNLLPNSWNI